MTRLKTRCRWWGAAADLGREVGQGRNAVAGVPDGPAQAAHGGDAGIGGRRVLGAAPLARAEARVRRRLGHGEECHLRAPGTAARTRRMTENAGRAHRIDERPVTAPVPRQHGAPPFVVVHGKGCRRLNHDAHGTRAGGEIYPKLALELVNGGGIGPGAGAMARPFRSGVELHRAHRRPGAVARKVNRRFAPEAWYTFHRKCNRSFSAPLRPRK